MSIGLCGYDVADAEGLRQGVDLGKMRHSAGSKLPFSDSLLLLLRRTLRSRSGVDAKVGAGVCNLDLDSISTKVVCNIFGAVVGRYNDTLTRDVEVQFLDLVPKVNTVLKHDPKHLRCSVGDAEAGNVIDVLVGINLRVFVIHSPNHPKSVRSG